MSDLIAIGYPDEQTAELAADEARRLGAATRVAGSERDGRRLLNRLAAGPPDQAATAGR